MRTFVSISLGTLLVTGCLFPSFDDMQGGTKGEITPRSESAPAQSPASEGSETIDASSEAMPDATAEAPKTPAAQTAGVLRCETDAGVCPADGQSFCCATFGGPSCQGPGTEGFCKGFPENGDLLRCDGNDDCPASAGICCFVASAKEAACTASCGGRVLCTKENPKCPAGQSCTGVITHGGGFTSSFCQ